MKTLAIIPARGGSKRLPGKNTKSFLGAPLIAWSIRFAQRQQRFDKVIVSTDSEEIAEEAVNLIEASYPMPSRLDPDQRHGMSFPRRAATSPPHRAGFDNRRAGGGRPGENNPPAVGFPHRQPATRRKATTPPPR